MPKNNILEQIKSGQGNETVTSIKKVLGQKLFESIQNETIRVAAEVYGGLEEENLSETGVNRAHPSFRAGETSYNNAFRKAATSLPQQERKNNHTFVKAHTKHIAGIGNLPDKLDAGRHFTAGYEAAHAKHRSDFQKNESVLHEASNHTDHLQQAGYKLKPGGAEIYQHPDGKPRIQVHPSMNAFTEEGDNKMHSLKNIKQHLEQSPSTLAKEKPMKDTGLGLPPKR